MKAVYRLIFCASVTFLFAAVSLNAQDEQNAQAETGSGGNPWFNLKLAEHPWYFGVYGGWTYNTLYQGGAEDYRPTQAWEGAGGWTIGLPVRYQIFNWLGVQAEPSYITKNYTTRWTGDYKDLGENTTTNGFVEVPLLANLSIGLVGNDNARLRLFANAGFFMGVWVYSREQGMAPILADANPLYGTATAAYEYDTLYTFDERRDNRFDAGFLAGFGAQFDVKAFSVFAEGRYNYAFTDLQKQYQKYDFAPQMNDTWSVQAGILINPGLFGGGR
jgi:hypothetical protein